MGNVFGQLPQVPIDEWIRTHPLEKLSVYYSGADSAARRHHISLIVFAATTLSTVFAAIYVYLKARKVRPIVLAEFEAARIQQEKALEAGDEAIEDDSIQLEEMEIVSPRVRPSFPSGSLSGLRVGVLQGGYGRGRSDSLNSPSASAPHLPLYSEAGTPGEYFDGKDAKEGAALFTVNSTNSNCSSRRGSF